MTEDEFLTASPREIALYVARLKAHDEKTQWHTSQLRADLHNLLLGEEDRRKAGFPDGWTPLDFMPNRKRQDSQSSLKEWAMAMERNGFVDEPLTEEEQELERQKAAQFKKQFTTTFTHEGKVQLVPMKE